MSDEKARKMIELVIARFNASKGRHYGYKSNEHLYDKYQPIVKRLGLKGVLQGIDRYEGTDIHEYFNSLADVEEVREAVEGEELELGIEAEEAVPAKKEEPEAKNGLAMLEQAIAGTISKDILGRVEKKCDNFIKETYGSLPKVISIEEKGKKPRKMGGIFHEKFEQVLKFVSADVPVFLAGPAGSGKNVICKQISEALELDFYFSNAVTQEYKLTGFTDANGHFHESQFYKAFKNGGLFFLDEMDASVPEVLIILNAAIANGYFDFPAPIGKVEAHEDFRVVSAGNTFGLGASIEYTGRNQLDGASLDRFAVIEIDYSRTIELALCDNDKELVNFIGNFRDVCIDAGIQCIVSYRAVERIHKMQKLVGLETAVQTCLIKNLRSDDLGVILQDIESSKYKNVIKKLAS